MAYLSVHEGAVFDSRDMADWKAALSTMTFTAYEQSKLTLTSGNTTITISGAFDSHGGGETLASYSADTRVTDVTMRSTDLSVEYTLIAATTLGAVLASNTPYDLLSPGGALYVDNRLVGFSGNDWIVGTAGADLIEGAGGDDTIEGGAGADMVYGGDGVNTAKYSGSLSDYLVSDDGNGIYHITDLRNGSPNGTDRLDHVQKLAFDDGQIIDVADAVADKFPSAPTLSATTIDENAAAGTVIGSVSSVDPEGQPITYHVLQATDVDGTGFYDFFSSTDFSVVDGKLVALRSFDFEKEKSFLLEIVASDRGVHQVTSTFTITVGDVSDVINGTKYNDVIKGGDLKDTINGLEGSDRLIGGAGNDVIRGGAGGDKIEGGLGADQLFGGTQNDIFIYRAIADSTLSVSGRDTIFDFSKGDVINLQQIDADAAKAGEQAFHFIGTHAFSGHAGDLRYMKSGSDTYIYADIDGDKKADFSIHLDTAMSLSKGDFIL